jgi:hypothetical protein
VSRRIRVERIKLQSLATTRAVALFALVLVLLATINALDAIDLGRPAPVLKGEGFRVLGQHVQSAATVTRAEIRTALGTWALVAFVSFSFGVLVFATERRHQTLAASLLGIPRRHELLAAKLGAVIPYAIVIAGAALALDAVLAGTWLHQNDVSVGIGASHWVRIVLGGLAANALAASAGVAVGVFVTAPASGIIGGLAVILVAEPVLASRSEALARWLPGHALDACFAGVSSLTSGDLLPQAAGLAVLAGWTLVAITLAVVTLEHRDVI